MNWANHFKQLSSSSSFGAEGTIDTAVYPHTDTVLKKTKAPNVVTDSNFPSISDIASAVHNVESLPATWTTQTLPEMVNTLLHDDGGMITPSSFLPKHFWLYVAGVAVMGLWILPKVLGAASSAAGKAAPFLLL